MRLLFELDAKDYELSWSVFSRPSARDIILWDNKVAMVHSLRYHYYKFPGGGVEYGEHLEETLLREVAEESGLRVIPASIQEYGLVRRIQKGNSDHIFLQDNYYFLCNAEPVIGTQQLDSYEAEERFTLSFTRPDHAIQVNRCGEHGPKDPLMLEREARVLELLMADGLLFP